MLSPAIQPLAPNSPWLTRIAVEHFEFWGPLTGHGSRSLYESFLEQAARSTDLPKVLIANVGGALAGSVNLLVTEMSIRPQLTPWMGQLFVVEGYRSLGIGAALLDAAATYVGTIGYDQLFLFTSGTLPGYYRSRGWSDVEEVTYLGRTRTIMRRQVTAMQSDGA
jgi:GNAT superfamily N-acetyltransferase